MFMRFWIQAQNSESNNKPMIITNTIICLPVTKLTFANYSEYTPGKLKVYPAPNFISSITYDYTWI